MIRLAVSLITMACSWAAPSASLAPRSLPPRHDECQLCHLRKKLEFMPAAKAVKKEHKGFSLTHSKTEISCNACHDANNSNRLRSTPGFPASFENSSPVCRRCHAEVFKDWQSGVHGKRSGSWAQEQLQNHCIDCHDPHKVRFREMRAEPKPPRPRFGVRKDDAGE